MRNYVFAILTGLSIVLIACSSQTPIQLHPENPHYFMWKNQPTILVGSTEHYGAVLNLDFDFAPYLQTLQNDGLNLTRTFSGVYCEHAAAFNIAENTLAPLEGKLICPWQRSDLPGYAGGGNKFDLTAWDDAYFARLKEFVTLAGKHNVVVELVLFCPFYGDEQWQLSPLNFVNNVNGIGNVGRTEVYSLLHEDVTKVQDEMVRKIVTELNGFDNLYFEICNEPYFAGPTLEWQAHIAQVIKETEAALPKQHLIAQNIANNAQKIIDPDPNVDLFNFHYAFTNAVDENYGLNKALGDDETGFAGTADEPYRLEAWNFILAGGALFDHLDYSFTAEHESGTFEFPSTQPGGGGPALRQQFKILKNFVESFDFINMVPAQEIFPADMPGELRARALAKTGEEYAIYFSRQQQLQQNFSLRWSGTITSKYSETYTFYTVTDDGARLWVNGKQLVDDWTGHAPLENSGSIALNAGKSVPITMEFYQGAGGASAQLLWSCPSQPKELIPANAFKLGDGSAPGLKIEWFEGINLQNRQAEAVVFQVAFDGSLEGVFPASAQTQSTEVVLRIPAGSYNIQWLDTLTGEKNSATAEATNDGLRLAMPEFQSDIALDIRR